MLRADAEALPTKINTFTRALLEKYDITSNLLTVSLCLDIPNKTYPMITCGAVEGSLPQGKLAEDVAKIAASGPLAASGRVVPIKFSSYITGDNNGAPVFILQRGFPKVIEFKVPQNVARSLFEIAKGTPALAAYPEYRGKLLTAKVAFNAPRLKGFAASNYMRKLMFNTLVGGAVVEYETIPNAICLYDGDGKTSLFCTGDLRR